MINKNIKGGKTGGIKLRSIEFAGDEYVVGTNVNGSPNRLSRYNKNYCVNIALCFTDTESPAIIAEIKNGLKDAFISKIKLLPNNK